MKRHRTIDAKQAHFDARFATAEASLEFGRFQVLLRQRRLVADGTPIELGSRAFELLLALLEADGSLVSKEQLLARVWPGIVVAEDNLKVQVSALRRALGKDSDFVRTEFGRGYRFIAAVRSTVPLSIYHRCIQPWHRSNRRVSPQRTTQRSYCGWPVQANLPKSRKPFVKLPRHCEAAKRLNSGARTAEIGREGDGT